MSGRSSNDLLFALAGPARISPGPPHAWVRQYHMGEVTQAYVEIGMPTRLLFRFADLETLRLQGWCV